MKVLVSGGAGYIGSHTCVELANADHDFLIVDNFCNSKEQVIQRISKIIGKQVRYLFADVCDQELMHKTFAEYQPDAVIHFAGYKAVGESVQKPLAYYRNNLDSTLTLAELCVEYGVKSLVFSSSATVYNVGDEIELSETAPLSANSPYGWTKYMSEQILRDVAVAHPELSILLLRYFNPVGAHASGLIGEDPQGIPNNLMPYISQVAIGKLKQVNVFGDDYNTPDGTGVRDYLHVVDLAKGHVAAVNYCAEHNGALAVNLGTGKGTSVLELINTFSQVNGVEIPYEIVERRPGDIAACYANPNLAKELLGWQTELELVDMCRDTWRWQQMNPQGYGE